MIICLTKNFLRKIHNYSLYKIRSTTLFILKLLTFLCNMANTVTKLYILSVIFGWAAFGLGVISISSANWKYFSSESFHGLWVNCTSADDCVFIC